MIPAELYTPLYHHAMLLVVIGCALLYWARQGQVTSLIQFNQVAMIVIGISVLSFIGFRPINGAFVDMTNYARSFEHVQQGIEASLGDWLFDGLMQLCSPVVSVEGFFFICALIYIAPLAVASWRVHGAWAFPVFLACLTAFSFWGYGVNGIRNGMATSVLILAFAFYDKPVLMLTLMVAAWGFHGSVLLPAGAFLIVRHIKRTEIWLAFWVMCVATSLVAGNVGEVLLSHFNPFTWDNRVESYIINSEGSGFRADFIVYSIIPVVATLLLAAPTRARLKRTASRLMNRPAMNWMRKRSAISVKATARGSLLYLQGASPVGSVAGAGFAHLSGGPSSSLTGAGKASGSQAVSAQRAGVNQTEWNRLPWVRLLRMDPFYARLVNTYLLTNAIWALLIQANFSNRFAYLSWFMLPWVLLYPFVPGKIIQRPRTGLIAATLFAHYMFTYGMMVVVYPLRGERL